MSDRKLTLAPVPRRMTVTGGTCHLTANAHVLVDDRTLYKSLRIAAARCPITADLRFAVSAAPDKSVITFRAAYLPHEAYALTVAASGITVAYGDAAGAFYAMSTLVQLCESYGRSLPCLVIEDRPAFRTRGYMLDIGRNKVPKLSEIEALCDWLASIKINHVELYMEGVPFEYPSMPWMWEKRDLLTGEDILALDAYCRDRFIELVPTQNNFGHMDKWLKKEYRDLAECPDGFHFQGGFFPEPRCLNPLDPRSEGLVNRLADDLLPYFSSDKYNVCCDETLELGQGYAKEACEKDGKGRVYLEFLKKVCAAARRHGKQALFWDDIIINYPELLPELPQDVIALEWGYMPNQPSEEHCRQLHELGVRYYVCPGTGAWNTLLGKTGQMIANIRNAAEYGLRWGAEGLLNTDWGDCGHPQVISTSRSGILYGAALAWSPAESRDMDLAAALDEHVYMDAAHVMGQLVLDAGNYYKEEKVQPHNITQLFLHLISGLDAVNLADQFTPEDYDKLDAYFAELSGRLERVDLRAPDGALTVREFGNAIGILRQMVNAGRYCRAALDKDERAASDLLRGLSRDLPQLTNEWRGLWLGRNKFSWLDETAEMMERIAKQAAEKLHEMSKAGNE